MTSTALSPRSRSIRDASDRSAAWIGQAVNRTESSYIPSTEFSLIPGVYQVVQSFADPTGGKWQIT